MKPDYNKLSDTVFDVLFWGVFIVLMLSVAWFVWLPSTSLDANILSAMIFMLMAAVIYLIFFAPVVGALLLILSLGLCGSVAIFYHLKTRRYQPFE